MVHPHIKISSISPLERQIRSIIAKKGPITIVEYMSLALSEKTHGYYIKKDPLGKAGDFITAPEISQLFGEMIGVWCAHTWQAMNFPNPVALVELGPGRGTLMKDLLRATRHVSGFHNALSVQLVENSPALIKTQKATLAQEKVSISWHNTINELPNHVPLLVVANEFLDALPIHQYRKTKTGWHEVMVALDNQNNLTFQLSSSPTTTLSIDLATEGDIYEYCPSAIAVMQEISLRIKTQGGAALFIDYGYLEDVFKDTLQAVKEHHYHPVLKDPGEADLTAYVNFSLLASVAKKAGVCVFPPVTQRDFLTALGIRVRAATLLQKSPAYEVSGLERLIDPAQMGTLFKCLGLTHPSLRTLIGF